MIDRGMLVEPPMSDHGLGEIARIAADSFRQHLAAHVWHEFWRRVDDSVDVASSSYPDGYWRVVLDHAQQAGPHAALLVPYLLIGDSIARWQYDQAARPDYLEIQRLESRPSGGGRSYVATVNGLDVFTAQLVDGHSYLFSHKLKSVIYRQVEPDKFLTVEFQNGEDGDDPFQGRIALRFSQGLRWRDTKTIRFVLTEPS